VLASSSPAPISAAPAVTAWPGGASAIAFGAIAVLLFAPQADRASAAAARFIIGVLVATVAAAIIKFGALLAQPWPTLTPMFTAMTGLFVAVLAPLNHETYDTAQFYNSSLEIFAGLGTAMLAFRLLPPLSPAFRTRRLLILTLRDLRRLARRSGKAEPTDWQGLVYGRLAVLPPTASFDDGSWLLGALAFGEVLIQLREIAGPAGFGDDFGTVCDAVARGDSAFAVAALARLDRDLAARSGGGGERALYPHARAGILAIAEALAQYPAYFDAKAPP
jgi:uncharacterized membrane protein YccC